MNQTGSPLSLGFNIVKVDEARREVWGVATAEVPDKQDDIVDYEGSKRAFDQWAPIGNIREQHDKTKAAGTAFAVQYVDSERHVLLGCRISKGAEDTWQKVLDGTLKGLSISGKVVKSRPETLDTGHKVNRILEYRIDEVSLVDNPACPVALISMVKTIDGRPTATELVDEGDPPVFYPPASINPADQEALAKALATDYRVSVISGVPFFVKKEKEATTNDELQEDVKDGDPEDKTEDEPGDEGEEIDDTNDEDGDDEDGDDEDGDDEDGDDEDGDDEDGDKEKSLHIPGYMRRRNRNQKLLRRTRVRGVLSEPTVEPVLKSLTHPGVKGFNPNKRNNRPLSEDWSSESYNKLHVRSHPSGWFVTAIKYKPAGLPFASRVDLHDSEGLRMGRFKSILPPEEATAAAAKHIDGFLHPDFKAGPAHPEGHFAGSAAKAVGAGALSAGTGAPPQPTLTKRATHPGDDGYLCANCGKVFKDRDSWKDHRSSTSHVEASGSGPFSVKTGDEWQYSHDRGRVMNATEAVREGKFHRTVSLGTLRKVVGSMWVARPIAKAATQAMLGRVPVGGNPRPNRAAPSGSYPDVNTALQVIASLSAWLESEKGELSKDPGQAEQVEYLQQALMLVGDVFRAELAEYYGNDDVEPNTEALPPGAPPPGAPPPGAPPPGAPPPGAEEIQVPQPDTPEEEEERPEDEKEKTVGTKANVNKEAYPEVGQLPKRAGVLGHVPAGHALCADCGKIFEYNGDSDDDDNDFVNHTVSTGHTEADGEPPDATGKGSHAHFDPSTKTFVYGKPGDADAYVRGKAAGENSVRTQRQNTQSVQKFAGSEAFDGLRKSIDGLVDVVKGMEGRLAKVEALPAGGPEPVARAVDKTLGGAAMAGGDTADTDVQIATLRKAQDETRDPYLKNSIGNEIALLMLKRR